MRGSVRTGCGVNSSGVVNAPLHPRSFRLFYFLIVVFTALFFTSTVDLTSSLAIRSGREARSGRSLRVHRAVCRQWCANKSSQQVRLHNARPRPRLRGHGLRRLRCSAAALDTVEAACKGRLLPALPRCPALFFVFACTRSVVQDPASLVHDVGWHLHGRPSYIIGEHDRSLHSFFSRLAGIVGSIRLMGATNGQLYAAVLGFHWCLVLEPRLGGFAPMRLWTTVPETHRILDLQRFEAS